MTGFVHWWQHLPENLDPVLLRIGGFSIQYYGLMYLAAFAVAYLLARSRIRREPDSGVTDDDLQSLMTAMILGVLIGGRLGYVVFYNPGYYLRHPAEIILPFAVDDGWRFTGIAGMSFHGGLIGVVLAAYVVVRRRALDFRRVADLIVPCVPLGYTFGRIGNFINGELFGRPTTVAWGMIFPGGGPVARHPSQLYEALCEGLIMFILLWSLRTKPWQPDNRLWPHGSLTALLLIGYGVMRFLVEFTRQPDPQVGYILSFFTMGQVLCSVMIIGGLAAWYALVRSAETQNRLPQ